LDIVVSSEFGHYQLGCHSSPFYSWLTIIYRIFFFFTDPRLSLKMPNMAQVWKLFYHPCVVYYGWGKWGLVQANEIKMFMKSYYILNDRFQKINLLLLFCFRAKKRVKKRVKISFNSHQRLSYALNHISIILSSMCQ
jgi:hypothetical protein